MGSKRSDPRTVLLEIGGDIFGQKAVANETLRDYESLVRPDQIPVVVAWGVYMELLEDRNLTGSAFAHGMARYAQDIIRYSAWRGLPIQDAEDVSQVISISAWRSFVDYKPWLAHWKTWLFMITNLKLNTYFRDLYKAEKVFYLDDLGDVFTEDIVESTPVLQRVAVRWVNQYDGPRAAFATELLRMSSGESGWIGPQGPKMQQLVGVSSRKYLNRWFVEFAQEVRDESES